MLRLTRHMRVLCFICAIAVPLMSALDPDQVVAAAADKVKVLYHIDGKDPEVAKYALALINKHIDAEADPTKSMSNWSSTGLRLSCSRKIEWMRR